MKIGLTGTMSVGKSTLAKALGELEQFKGYSVQTERSKYLRDMGISLNTDSTLKGQLIFAAERSIELMQPNIITDRTVYDVCAFTLSAKSIGWYEKRYFTEVLMALRTEYDAIVYVSPEGIPIENNGVRETDAKYREQIDVTIREMLNEFKPTKLITVSGSTEERINTIISQLS
jgi:deoxyadenosine/deoxycytidine kinase